MMISMSSRSDYGLKFSSLSIFNPSAQLSYLMAVASTSASGAYKPLNDGDEVHVSEKRFSPRASKTRTRVHFAGLWVFIITQAVVISLLLRKLNQQAEANGVHLYSMSFL